MALRTVFDEFPSETAAQIAHRGDHLVLHRWLNQMGIIAGLAGDGVADDAPMIQSAINQRKAVWLPAGQFRLASPLRITTNDFRWFRGTGMKDSTLKPDPGVNAIEFAVTSGHMQHAQFSDFGIVGGARGIYATPANTLTIECDFERIYMRGYSESGIEFASAVYFSLIRRVICFGNDVGKNGIYLHGGDAGFIDLMLQQVRCDAHQDYGLLCEPDTFKTGAMQLMTGWFQANRKAGVRFYNCAGVRIVDASFEGNGPGVVGAGPDIEIESKAGSANTRFVIDGCSWGSGSPAVKIIRPEGILAENFYNYEANGRGIQWGEGTVMYDGSFWANIFSAPTVEVNNAGVQQ